MGAPKSSELQVREPMETCSGDASSSTETEESEGEGEDSDSGWDKDSFDGREYHSSDYPVYSDEELDEQCRNYYRAVIETKGFFEPSGNFPRYHWSGIVPVPGDLDKKIREGLTVRQLMENMASECVEEYNKREATYHFSFNLLLLPIDIINKNVKLDHFLRANFNPGGRTKYYITFAARESDSPDAPLVEYEAKAIREAGETYPILCRPAKKGCLFSQETLVTSSGFVSGPVML
ncbi:unnamed protein product [Thlaspi arvense]|uniref:Uncharacterized protein n=1 Tax=Thlaspi arvense TaxID=13288 RepID=A0AAU9S2M2_THLAR|nr:unnamed protein product [Thlaspi arvense]